MDYKEQIKEYCRGLNLDLVGFSRCRIYDALREFFIERRLKGKENEFEEKNTENRVNPFLLLPGAETIISIAFPYYFGNFHKDRIFFSSYTLGRDYHIVVSEYLKKICIFIENMGFKAKYFVDNNPLPERYLAKESGIGIIGRNGMLITDKYGSYVFLGEILTDLKIEDYDKPMDTCGTLCNNCNKCSIACPSGSLKGRDSCICLSYITQKKHIEDAWFSELKGRIFGCDTCQEVCPYNKRIEISNLEEFLPLPYMKNIDITELLNINNPIFKEKYKLTSAGWRGKNILQRNAMINSINDPDCRNVINPQGMTSPYIREYYGRLLKTFNL